MNRKILLFVMIPLMLMCWNPVNAAEPGKTLTLDKALKIALESNLQLQQASNRILTGQLAVRQKKANFLPDMNISARSTERYSKEYNQVTGSFDGTSSGSLSLSASSSINLFNGFNDIASLQQSKLELDATRQDVSRTRQSIIYETIQRFIQVVTAGELIAVEKENLEAQRLLAQQVENFYKSRKRPITDFYQQQAEISRAELQLLNAQRNLDVNKLLLMQTLGLPPTIDYEVENPGIDELVSRILNLRSEEALNEALDTRPDIKAQQFQVEAAYKGLKIAYSGYFPKLSLSADIGTSYSNQNALFNFPDQFFKGNIGGSVGLSLSIPVFDKFRTRYSVALSNIELKNQKLQLESARLQVQVEIQQALHDYQTAVKQLDVAENQLKYSKDALDSMQERYKVNAATMVELTQARSRYLQSIYDRVQSRFNVLIRGIAISFYKGDNDGMIRSLEK